MNRKVPLWMFLVSTVIAFTGFALWGKSNLDRYDRVYGLHTKEFYSKGRVLELLNENRVEDAKMVLKKELEAIGAAVAMCLMNDCSSEAKKIRDEFKKPITR